MTVEEYYNLGEAHYKSGKYSNAQVCYEKAIQKYHRRLFNVFNALFSSSTTEAYVNSLYRLGTLHAKEDRVTAMKYYREAEEEKHYDSIKELLKLETPSDTTAEQWISSGDRYYSCFYKDFRESLFRLTKFFMRALACYEIAYEITKNPIHALYIQGLRHQYGQGVERSHKKAGNYYIQAVLDHAEARNRILELHLTAEHESLNQLIALDFSHFTIAEEWYALAEDYYFGKDDKVKNYARARICYENALKQDSNHANSLYRLGYMYAYGLGGKQKAGDLYKRSAEAGNQNAKHKIKKISLAFFKAAREADTKGLECLFHRYPWVLKEKFEETRSECDIRTAHAAWIAKKAIGYGAAVVWTAACLATGGAGLLVEVLAIGTVAVPSIGVAKVKDDDIAEYIFNREGWTALHFAAAANKTNAAKFLLANDGDIDDCKGNKEKIRDAEGRTFLEIANDSAIRNKAFSKSCEEFIAGRESKARTLQREKEGKEKYKQAFENLRRQLSREISTSGISSPKVFISYAWEKDDSPELKELQDWLKRLKHDLLQLGVREVFLDVEGLHGDIRRTLKMHIDESDYFIIICSKQYKKRIEAGMTDTLKQCMNEEDSAGRVERRRRLTDTLGWDDRTDNVFNPKNAVSFEFCHIIEKVRCTAHALIPLRYDGSFDETVPSLPGCLSLPRHLIRNAQDCHNPKTLKEHYSLLLGVSNPLGIIPAIYHLQESAQVLMEHYSAYFATFQQECGESEIVYEETGRNVRLFHDRSSARASAAVVSSVAPESAIVPH